MQRMRLTRRRVAALAVVAALGLCVVVTAASRGFRSWLWEATGEESYVEGVKGVVALALLQVTGPRPDLAPDAPLKDLPVGPVGVNTFLQLEADPDVVRRSFETMNRAGITWARQQFPWEDIEIHGRGDYEDRRNDPPRSAWDKYDRIVQMAGDYGVHLLVRLDDPPEWAYADPAKSGDKGPPDDMNDYAAFVEQVARRYCGKVQYYQLWNEPNIYPEWGERDVDPAGYAKLLAAGAAAAREACPGVTIVSAALAQNTEPGGKNMDDLKYLEGLYAAGWQKDFDVLAVQAFGLFTGPTDHRVSRDRANFGRMLLSRDLMVRHGDAAKPVWITEMGWTSPPPDYPTKFGRVDEARRAVYTERAYERIREEWPWIGPAFMWFFRRPDDLWERAKEGYGFFRLLGPDFAETPSFQALKDVANEPPILYRGRHGLADPALHFSGPWRVGTAPNGVRYREGSPDAELQFTFRGNGFTVVLAPPADGTVPTKIFVVVDGDTQEVTPVLQNSLLTFGVQGLASAEHLAIARVDEGAPRVAEVRVAAQGVANPLQPMTWLLAIGLLVVVVGVVLYVVWRRRWSKNEQPPLPQTAPPPDDQPPAA
jgi:polysaccharide biosynthesis protein PslG